MSPRAAMTFQFGDGRIIIARWPPICPIAFEETNRMASLDRLFVTPFVFVNEDVRTTCWYNGLEIRLRLEQTRGPEIIKIAFFPMLYFDFDTLFALR